VAKARFRFYAELNDFLPPDRRMVAFDLEFQGRQTVKHLIESVGVPHTEVDLVLVNGESVDFARIVEGGDRVSVYPVFEAFDITPESRVRPQPLRQTRFVLDAHLGRLAAWLRLLGFDTLYRNDATDEQLARNSSAEHRILLTRDRGLLKRSAVTHGYCVRESNARRQLAEVVQRFDLAGCAMPFTRCLLCNQPLRDVAMQDVASRIPPAGSEHCDFVRECPRCRRLFWNGSRYRRIESWIDTTLRLYARPAGDDPRASGPQPHGSVPPE
jgi:hypothetical protein